MKNSFLHSLATLLLVGCAAPRPCITKSPSPPIQDNIVAHPSGPALSRSEFNSLAVELDIPLFWSEDISNKGVLDRAELAVLGTGKSIRDWINDSGPTNKFREAIYEMKQRRRHEALARELAQSRPTLVYADLSKASEQDKAIVRHITNAAALIEELYSMQLGSFALRKCVPPSDYLSLAVFRRNQSPWCQAPGSEDDPFCNACPSFVKKRSGLYPLDIQQNPNFCEQLSHEPNAKKLMDPFTVVKHAPGGKGFIAQGYNIAYAEQVKKIASELRATAGVITKGEGPFKKYLLAAAKSFETNEWELADEAWAAMNGSNSKWYLRIGPDEVYYEPCNRKAGFHVSFARIDKDGIYWQKRLSPLRQEMEDKLASLIGPDYKARKVNVHMPDFIEILINAGDSRHASGATVGQSLPNWGPVAKEGRGRTVVMSTLYTDRDSMDIQHAKAESLFSAKNMDNYTDDKRLGLLDIILHEATHNFGPYSDYKIHDKRPGDIFGGATASILEELKAQTGALFFIKTLLDHGLLTEQEAKQVWLHSIAWCFGHISRGMTDAQGHPKPYSQLAAIQIGFLSSEGAIEFKANQLAANGKDKGCFHVDFDKFFPAVEKLMKKVGHIKATGDKKAADKLITSYTTGELSGLVHQKEITTRVLRYPKASFVYSIAF